LAGFAWTGAVAASALFLVSGTNWQLGLLLLFVANICLFSSLVIYDSLLIRIAGPDDRDRVSSRGWGLGYLGGGLLLALNFALVLFHDRFGMDTRLATRISLLSAGLWWGVFTIIPVVGLRRVSGSAETSVAPGQGVFIGSFRQLAATFRELGRYPQTQLFLLAYLFYNDGIQTVIASSSLYGVRELQFSESTVLGLFLFVQFIAFIGALLFGRVAARIGAWRTVLYSLGVWTVVVVVAFFVPAKALVAFFALGLVIGLVLGGSQALSRSLYSQLIPRGREAEFFGFYQAMERGTSWFGTLIFGVVYQLTLSYRWAIAALIVFFVLGGALLARVRMREGILAAGNQLPAVL
ncbi:MAG: MFS transporter, partial [Dermatophilaceae bacterium]